jgi:putative transposase
MKSIREKPHRLPREQYQGQVTVAFALRLKQTKPFFVQPGLVGIFVKHLRTASIGCEVSTIYCFMPEHLHTISIGHHNDSDALRSIETFKHSTGWWLKNNRPETKWQKSSYDRIARAGEGVHLADYLINNPVRRGLVSDWRDYPFTGAIGLDLDQYLQEIM